MAPASSSALSDSALRQAGRHRSFVTLRVVLALMLREMSTTYGRSPGGYIWAILEPVAGIALLTFIFSLVFHAPALGVSFPIFYATGFVPFLLYLNISGKIAASISFSRQLLFYPSVTVIDSLVARFALNFLVQLLVAYIVFSGILILFETQTVLNAPAIGLALLMAGALAFSVGTLNCFLMGVFPIWQQIWSILNRPLFIISCIFFLFDSIPEPYRSWLWYNPLVHIVGQMRRGFYPYYDAPYVSPAYVFGICLVLGFLGMVFLPRYTKHILSN